MSQTRAPFTRRARFTLPIGGRSDAGRADRALTPRSRPFFVFVPCSAQTSEGGKIIESHEEGGAIERGPFES
jgi:hypothetical protein